MEIMPISIVIFQVRVEHSGSAGAAHTASSTVLLQIQTSSFGDLPT
jgi:hypothetical protein